MKESNQTVVFNFDYLVQLAMKEAKHLPLFKGQPLYAKIYFDVYDNAEGIEVSTNPNDNP